jgi:predicted enzyme related to lactoylglutathione lyase
MGAKGTPEQVPMNYYRTDDLEAANQRVRDNGRHVLMEKMPVPAMSYFSVCLDPEGNVFGHWIDDETATV